MSGRYVIGLLAALYLEKVSRKIPNDREEERACMNAFEHPEKKIDLAFNE